MTNRLILLIGGPLVGLITGLLCISADLDMEMAKVVGMITWMAFWWVSEVVELYITALLPVVLFPFLGILPMADVAPLYMKDIIFLFLGGFLFAYAMEKWGLHRRIALGIILRSKGAPSRVLIGFMAASYFLSMWILNTATVTMLLPATLAVIYQIAQKNQENRSRVATPYLLGLAYASSIGGMATLIGTAPNMALMEAYNSKGGVQGSINFANWMMVGLPISLVLLVICYRVLLLQYRKVLSEQEIDLGFCETAYKEMGPVKREERILAIVFGVLVAGWFFMKDINFGGFTLPGWTNLLEKDFVKESTLAIFAASLLFFIPSKDRKTQLLTWEEARRLPIGIIFLFGAGFSIAKSVETSGLAALISKNLFEISSLHPLLVVLIGCLVMTFVTEISSNTASIFLFIPILFAMQPYVDCHPLQFYIPITFSASCAFMLPVATPPNTIVFGSELLQIKKMAKTGLVMNLLAILVISFLSYFLVGLVF